MAAGKDEVAEYLISKGAYHVSLSEEILKQILARGIEVSRKAYVDTANSLREKYGHGILVKRAFAKLTKVPKFVVVSSIRHPGEVEQLRSFKDLFLIAVNADPKIRFERMNKRIRKGDASAWEDFLKFDKESLKSANPAHEQIAKCLAMADFTIENNGTIRQLHRKINEVLTKL